MQLSECVFGKEKKVTYVTFNVGEFTYHMALDFFPLALACRVLDPMVELLSLLALAPGEAFAGRSGAP